MKSILEKILKLLLLGLIAYAVLGWLAAMSGGNVDFPCFSNYNPEKECVELGQYAQKIATTSQLDVYLSDYEVGWSGAGCYHSSSEEGTVEVKTPLEKYEMRREGGDLKVDGTLVEEKFKDTNYFHPNPWVVSEIQFENHGVTGYCGTSSTERLIVIGSKGTRFSFLKGIFFLFLVLLAWDGINHRRGKKSLFRFLKADFLRPDKDKLIAFGVLLFPFVGGIVYVAYFPAFMRNVPSRLLFQDIGSTLAVPSYILYKPIGETAAVIINVLLLYFLSCAVIRIYRRFTR